MPAEYMEWKANIQQEARLRGTPEFEEAVSLEVALRPDGALVRVSALPGRPTKRTKGLTGDVDNYVGAYMDALQGVAYENDRDVHDVRSYFV